MAWELQELSKGILTTVILTIGGCAIGFGCGTVLALLWILKHKKWILLISDILRGTPMLLQAILAKMLLGSYVPGLLLAILVFGINSMAYSSQIVLSAVNGISVGQKNVAMDLGASEYEAYTQIILPQALTNAIPALLNEFNSLLKESAIVGVIDIQDLLSVAETVGTRNNSKLSALIIAGIVYCIISCSAKFATERLINRKWLKTKTKD